MLHWGLGASRYPAGSLCTTHMEYSTDVLGTMEVGMPSCPLPMQWHFTSPSESSTLWLSTGCWLHPFCHVPECKIKRTFGLVQKLKYPDEIKGRNKAEVTYVAITFSGEISSPLSRERILPGLVTVWQEASAAGS